MPQCFDGCFVRFRLRSVGLCGRFQTWNTTTTRRSTTYPAGSIRTCFVSQCAIPYTPQVADSKPAAVGDESSGPRFEIKKWNAVAMWSWDICADTVRRICLAKESKMIDPAKKCGDLSCAFMSLFYLPSVRFVATP